MGKYENVEGGVLDKARNRVKETKIRSPESDGNVEGLGGEIGGLSRKEGEVLSKGVDGP